MGDIGMMSRGFKAEEATTAADGFTYTCVFGDVGSTGVSVDVANDGVTVFAQTGGTAGNCLEKLAPAGVTHDELVKMYLLRLLFPILQEAHMIFLKVLCLLMAGPSGQEMVCTLVLKVLMILYWSLLKSTQPL